MTDSSLLSTFPIEIIHEIIRNSDVATLARWSLTSRAFLAFAGPLLHEIVTLSRSQDVIPFVERLSNGQAQLSTPSSLPFPFLSSLRRLDILAFPSPEDSSALSNHVTLVSQEVPVLGISWEGQTEQRMAQVWIPSLLIPLRPQRYEELGKERCLYLSGELLRCYVHLSRQIQPNDDPALWGTLYRMIISWASVQNTIDLAINRAYTLVPDFVSSALLSSLVDRHEEIRAWFKGKSLLGSVEQTFDSASDLQTHVELQASKFEEFTDFSNAIKTEQNRLITASILELRQDLGSKLRSELEQRARSGSEQNF